MDIYSIIIKIKSFIIPKSRYFLLHKFIIHLQGQTTGKLTPVIDHSYDFFFFLIERKKKEYDVLL